jgi:hypothetical protein
MHYKLHYKLVGNSRDPIIVDITFKEGKKVGTLTVAIANVVVVDFWPHVIN